MPDPSNKKLLILYILNILREYSDEDHPIQQQEIIEKLRLIYGMEAERKAVANNLLSLEDCGYDIIKVPNKGWFLGSRELEPSEISFLVDALFSSKVIGSKQAQQLSAKLYGGLSLFQQKKYSYIYKADALSRSDNKLVFYTIDCLSRAIAAKKKVSFKYISYTSADGRIEKSGVVDPYYLVCSNGRYYLVCCRRKSWGLSNYRIDRMAEVTVTDRSATPINEVRGCEAGFDIAKYANENIYMFGGSTVRARLKITNDVAIGYIYDWFGSDARILKEPDGVFAYLEASEDALVYWVLQYGEIVELTAPAGTREKVKNMVSQLYAKYLETP